MGCPSDDIISEYLQGQLSVQARQLADHHLDACPECRALISELARSTHHSPEGAAAHGLGHAPGRSEEHLGEAQSAPAMPGVGPGVLIAGKYEIIEEIATGGMGVVYLAQQSGLNRSVAIKLMRASVAGSVDAAIRFTREARIAAQLSSPHIVSVVDIGLTEEGLPFIVMEHLKGRDLESHLAACGALPVSECIELARQICRGLHEAHSQGIVHRDLKPSNIFLVPEAGGGNRAVLLDFGVSKLTTQADLSLTQTGTVMGSPRYMSPEQLADSKGVDHRADIWSLGVIIYELLAGTPPYKSNTLVHLVAEILQGRPQPLREIRPDVPAGLVAIVERCLRREPQERFDNAQALAQALTSSQNDRFVSTQVAISPHAMPAARRAHVAPDRDLKGTAELRAELSAGQRTRQVAILVTLVAGVALLAALFFLGGPSKGSQHRDAEPAALPQPDPATHLEESTEPSVNGPAAARAGVEEHAVDGELDGELEVDAPERIASPEQDDAESPEGGSGQHDRKRPRGKGAKKPEGANASSGRDPADGPTSPEIDEDAILDIPL